MRMLNKKIKAFTIAELLVVLVISGIVISLSMLILNLVHKQISSIRTNTNTATEIRMLEKALLVDFNSHHLTYDVKQQQLYCISPIDSVYYKFTNEYVVRNVDTLQVPIYTTVSYLNGVSTTHSDIDALELQLSKENSTKKLFIYTTKDVAFYLNSDGI